MKEGDGRVKYLIKKNKTAQTFICGRAFIRCFKSAGITREPDADKVKTGNGERGSPTLMFHTGQGVL